MSDGERIRKINRHGELEAAGYEWHETFGFSGGVGALKAIVCLVFCAVGAVNEEPLTSLAAAIAFPCTLIFWFLTCDGYPRRVTFHRGGRIGTRYGLNWNYFWKFKVAGHHENIASIEAHKNQVRMYSHGGDIVFLGEPTDEFTAHKVAVQLTKALAEMREATADARTRAPNKVRPATDTWEVIE